MMKMMRNWGQNKNNMRKRNNKWEKEGIIPLKKFNWIIFILYFINNVLNAF